MLEKVVWKFQWGKNFGFLIPDDRESYGWDFYVNSRNFNEAVDWDIVVWSILTKTKWKKPEVKIIEVKWKTEKKWPERIIWIYSEHKWDFWFVDVESEQVNEKWWTKWYFVFKKDNGWAKDWDKVEARVKVYKWKKEAVIEKILENDSPLIIWEFKDQWGFWFVIPEKWTFDTDIFIAWAKKMGTQDGDKVWVQIIKTKWRRPEWVIRKVIK